MQLELWEIILLFILVVIAYDCIKQIINSITLNRFMKNLCSLPEEERDKMIKALSSYLRNKK